MTVNLQPPPLPPDHPAAPRPWHRAWRPYLLPLFWLAVAVAIYFFVLRVEIRFTDDAGRIPADFEAQLIAPLEKETVQVRNGRLHVLRWRWQTVKITDLTYIGEAHPIHGRRVDITIERNFIRKLRDAATAQHSVPQRGDPDPRND